MTPSQGFRSGGNLLFAHCYFRQSLSRRIIEKVILLLKLLGDRGTLRATGGRFMTGMLCEGGGGSIV